MRTVQPDWEDDYFVIANGMTMKALMTKGRANKGTEVVDTRCLQRNSLGRALRLGKGNSAAHKYVAHQSWTGIPVILALLGNKR